MSTDYTVGYGKPPKETQFRPGQSGNPKGRPKGTQNLKTDLVEELGEWVLVKEGSVTKTISKQRAMVKSLIAKAAQGDTKAINTAVNLMIRVAIMEELIEPGADLSATDLDLIERFKAQVLNASTKEST